MQGHRLYTSSDPPLQSCCKAQSRLTPPFIPSGNGRLSLTGGCAVAGRNPARRLPCERSCLSFRRSCPIQGQILSRLLRSRRAQTKKNTGWKLPRCAANVPFKGGIPMRCFSCTVHWLHNDKHRILYFLVARQAVFLYFSVLCECRHHFLPSQSIASASFCSWLLWATVCCSPLMICWRSACAWSFMINLGLPDDVCSQIRRIHPAPNPCHTASNTCSQTVPVWAL